MGLQQPQTSTWPQDSLPYESYREFYRTYSEGNDRNGGLNFHSWISRLDLKIYLFFHSFIHSFIQEQHFSSEANVAFPDTTIFIEVMHSDPLAQPSVSLFVCFASDSLCSYNFQCKQSMWIGTFIFFVLKDTNRKVVYFWWLKLTELVNTSIHSSETTITAYCLPSHQLHLLLCEGSVEWFSRGGQ